ncbi:MAG: hypothetical protein M1434_01525 [Chloroflexi bacterium]|nr:hypothetical protein [Chloroflexota bacterium]MCL5273411.1 hypothetical protein [Chloroflexota bacterium]
MSQVKSSKRNRTRIAVWLIAGVITAALALAATVLIGAVAQTPLGDSLGQALNSLFGTDTAHATWFITRSAGIVAYLLLWFSTA